MVTEPTKPTEPAMPTEPNEPDEIPGKQECLACYLERMLQRHGCDGSLRWTSQWRRTNAPASRLERSMRSQGGFCDCEVLINVFAVQPGLAGMAAP